MLWVRIPLLTSSVRIGTLTHQPDTFTGSLYEDRHQVVVLATTKPAEAAVPVSHESLADLAQPRKKPSKLILPGHPEKRGVEYVLHGTRCLLATFVVATGLDYGDAIARRTNQDFAVTCDIRKPGWGCSTPGPRGSTG